MNSHLSQYLNQLTREIRAAERAGDQTKQKRLEIAAHYILIKIYTGNGLFLEKKFQKKISQKKIKKKTDRKRSFSTHRPKDSGENGPDFHIKVEKLLTYPLNFGSF